MKMYSTREAAEEINKLNLFPSNVKPLNYRSVSRLCKLGRFPDAYGVRGYWCIPKASLAEFVKATREARKTTKPRKGNMQRKKKEV